MNMHLSLYDCLSPIKSDILLYLKIYIFFFCVTSYSKDLDLQDIEGETCILQKEAKK